MVYEHICPVCFSEDIVRVPRRGLWDYVVRLVGRRVYQCCECEARFYDRRAQPEDPDE